MSKTVYFVRHGECVANTKGVIAGRGDDSPLIDLGRSQAKETAPIVTSIDEYESSNQVKSKIYAY